MPEATDAPAGRTNLRGGDAIGEPDAKPARRNQKRTIFSMDINPTFPPQASAPHHRRISRQAVAVAVLGTLFSLILTVGANTLENDYVETDAHRQAETRIGQIRHGMEDGISLVSSVNQFFRTVGPVSRQQFHDFVQPLVEANPHVRALTYQRIVSKAERPAFEVELRKRLPGASITEFNGEKLVPAGDRPRYRVIEYVEPLAGNEKILGLDTDSRKEQEAAARRACRSGTPAASKPYRLAQIRGRQPGYVVVMPIYQRGAIPSDPQARCDAVIGYNTVAFDGAELVQNTLANDEPLRVPNSHISVYAGTFPDPAHLVFGTDHASAGATGSSWLSAAINRYRVVSTSETFEMAGQPWHVVIATPVPLLTAYLGTFLTLLGGLLMTLLAAVHAHSLAARSKKIQQVVDERTAKLVEVNQALRLWEEAIASSINGIIIAGASAPEYPIVHANPVIETITGYSTEELRNGSWRMLWRDEPNQAGLRKIAEAVAEEREVRATVRMRRKDGAMFWSEMQVAPVRDDAGKTNHFVVALHDVTDTRRYQAELEYQSTHDVLTGLASRNLLYERLMQVIDTTRDGGSALVAFINIDRFKFVNESLGRRAGDKFLQEIASRIKAAAGESSTVGRLSGDEFLMIIPQKRDEDTGTFIVRHVMDAVAAPITIDNHELLLSCCVGVAVYPNDDGMPDELIEHADMALHYAKTCGSSSLQFFTAAMYAAAQERLLIESALRNALDRSELEVHYQPQVDLRTGRVVGMEALTRWRHPQLGMVAPARFIAIAEDSGMIDAIGAWVLRTACRQAREWQLAGFGNLRMAVNLSARQFAQAGLVKLIADVLDETQLPPDLLDIELTERLIMHEVGHTVPMLSAMKELGVQVSIDDFGTGYSSLAYLKRFPIDALKIDQSFVAEISRDANDAAISNAIISMAHSLGIRVIAEGVETEAQCEFLSRNMCDEIQGFLFSQALPASEVELLLAAQRCLPERLLRLHRRPRTLLLVDDEPNILASIKRLLRNAGYRILTAASGQEGLDLLKENDVDVIVSDQRMPGMTGVEFLRAVKTSYPGTVRIVLSGFTELKSVTDAVNEGAIYKFLTKPWDDAKLREHIEEAFEHKEMSDENRRLNLEVRTANHDLATVNRKLEELLQQKQQKIKRDETTLDIVREALNHMSLPIIGLDQDEIITFANVAAQSLFRNAGELLGSKASRLMPEVVHLIRGGEDGAAQDAVLDGVRFAVVSRSMGKDEQARGKLITFTPGEFV